MYDVATTTASEMPTRTTRLRPAVRWMATFLGFPAGGLLSMLVVGPVDGLWAALVGGLLTGVVLGAVQAVGLGRRGPGLLPWATATGIGLMVGLGVGAGAVDYGTSRTALIVQGVICGLAVGAAQAVVLRDLVGRLALAWPPVLAMTWAVGWAVTAAFGVQVDDQFTVFGSSGAIVVTALTVVLPWTINSVGHRSAS